MCFLENVLSGQQVPMLTCNCKFQKMEEYVTYTNIVELVYPYCKVMSMKEVYKYNMNPVVQDSIRFDWTTQPPEARKQTRHPKKKRMRK